jgi:arylsulfatase
LCVGYDSGDAVSQLYKNPGEFKGGIVHFVEVSVGKDQYLDMAKEAENKMRD